MAQSKALFILHYSPPVHGASKVGDSIKNSKIINQSLNTKYIKIKSSNTINDIGKFHASKVIYSLDLFFRVCCYLVFFRPQIIYYTSSPSGFAFYRDFMVSLPIKIYNWINSCHIFYHYHSKGINNFVSNSNLAKTLTNFFLKGVSIILISKQMKSELTLLKGYNRVIILKNGVENMLNNNEFDDVINLRSNENKLNVLYLSNLMKDKGYDTALELANALKNINFVNFRFHFAGSWSSKSDELFFYNYVKKNKLESYVKYHGLVMGKQKESLFKLANIFLFPSRYKKEVFPLSVLEALSYGLPVLAFNAGAVSEIITKEIGIVTNKNSLLESFLEINKNYQSERNYKKCRSFFLDNYTQHVFEKNLLTILRSE